MPGVDISDERKVNFCRQFQHSRLVIVTAEFVIVMFGCNSMSHRGRRRTGVVTSQHRKSAEMSRLDFSI